MKAIFIDVKKETVERIELPDNSHARMTRIYALLGCRYVDAVRLDTANDAVFVDDEGLLGDMSQQRFFWLEGTHAPLAGFGIILGADYEGETVAPTITLEEVQSRLHFVRYRPAQEPHPADTDDLR